MDWQLHITDEPVLAHLVELWEAGGGKGGRGGEWRVELVLQKEAEEEGGCREGGVVLPWRFELEICLSRC